MKFFPHLCSVVLLAGRRQFGQGVWREDDVHRAKTQNMDAPPVDTVSTRPPWLAPGNDTSLGPPHAVPSGGTPAQYERELDERNCQLLRRSHVRENHQILLTKVAVLIPAPRNQLPILGDCVSSKITQVGVQSTTTCESHWEPTGQTPRTQYVDWLACETRCHGESESKTDQRSCALIRTRWRQPGEWEQQQARSRGSRSRPAARLSRPERREDTERNHGAGSGLMNMRAAHAHSPSCCMLPLPHANTAPSAVSARA
jgi:hypothetical protein